VSEKHEKKLIVIDFDGTPIISSGAYVTRDRVGVYPFSANTVAEGTCILQATAQFYRDKGYAEGLEAARKVSKKISPEVAGEQERQLPIPEPMTRCKNCNNPADPTFAGEYICRVCGYHYTIPEPVQPTTRIDYYEGAEPEPSQPVDVCSDSIDVGTSFSATTLTTLNADGSVASIECVLGGYTPPLAHPVPMAAVPADELEAGQPCEVPMVVAYDVVHGDTWHCTDKTCGKCEPVEEENDA
jgi:hypothetical protein